MSSLQLFERLLPSAVNNIARTTFDFLNGRRGFYAPLDSLGTRRIQEEIISGCHQEEDMQVFRTRVTEGGCITGEF